MLIKVMKRQRNSNAFLGPILKILQKDLSSKQNPMRKKVQKNFFKRKKKKAAHTRPCKLFTTRQAYPLHERVAFSSGHGASVIADTSSREGKKSVSTN